MSDFRIRTMLPEDRYEVAELLDLQAVRDRARERRLVGQGTR